MPFFTLTDIQAQLPASYDVNVVNNVLLELEADFRKAGLVFDVPILDARKMTPDRDYFCSVLDENIPFSTVTSVKLKQTNNTSERLLVAGIDYELILHNFDNFFTGIGLINRQISKPHFIEITAKFGLYIDCSSTTLFETKLLKALIVGWVTKQLEFSSMNHQNVSEARTGESTIKMTNNRTYGYFSILSDPEFQSKLSYFI
jgi:hypothetical protein